MFALQESGDLLAATDGTYSYICIDLKSYYASVECVARGLDPLKANLLVADESRSDQTICLAVSPSLKAKGVRYEIADDLRAATKVSDAVYMTRIQDEWDNSKGESAKIDTSRFKFGAEELALLGPDGIIMHPLPRRDEIATCCDHDPRAMYWRQMRNGMWIRGKGGKWTWECGTGPPRRCLATSLRRFS